MFLIIGNATVDLFVSGLERLPQTGGDEFTVASLAFVHEPLTMLVGGNAAICAFALARLGAQSAIGAAIGVDPLGDFVADRLASAGVDMRGLHRCHGRATATTVVVTDGSRNRLAFHHLGATDCYTPEQLPVERLAQANVLLLASYPMMARWRPHGFAATLRRARQAGVLTALDIGPAIGAPTVLNELLPLLPDVDYFLCNEHELAVCTGVAEIEHGMEMILEAGAGCAAIKRGRLGAVARRQGSPSVHAPGFAVDARFTVGAGDTFDAGFLYAIHQGRDLADALRFANATAALVVSAAQGALGAPTLTEVETFLVMNGKR
jgi:argininosuccinate lyase